MGRSLRGLAAAVCIPLGILFLAPTGATARAPTHPGKVAIIVIDKLAFGPSPTGLHAGDTLEWVNHDIFRHSATGKGFDLNLKPGAQGRLVLKGVGIVPYYCRYHPGMKAQFTIEP